MENVNLSAIPEQLGSWNWSAADTVRVQDPRQDDDRGHVLKHSNLPGCLSAFQRVCHVDVEILLQGKLELSAPAVPEDRILEFDGVHFTKNGSFYAFAQEEGYVTQRASSRSFL